MVKSCECQTSSINTNNEKITIYNIKMTVKVLCNICIKHVQEPYR